MTIRTILQVVAITVALPPGLTQGQQADADSPRAQARLEIIRIAVFGQMVSERSSRLQVRILR